MELLSMVVLAALCRPAFVPLRHRRRGSRTLRVSRTTLNCHDGLVDMTGGRTEKSPGVDDVIDRVNGTNVKCTACLLLEFENGSLRKICYWATDFVAFNGSKCVTGAAAKRDQMYLKEFLTELEYLDDVTKSCICNLETNGTDACNHGPEKKPFNWGPWKGLIASVAIFLIFCVYPFIGYQVLKCYVSHTPVGKAVDIVT